MRRSSGAGSRITGTWPKRTELEKRHGRVIGNKSNALASSIVLVCRRRDPDAPLASRREYAAALRAELPPALRLLQSEDIAPVDLAQAAIGPGMRVYTRYAPSPVPAPFARPGIPPRPGWPLPRAA